MKFRNLLLVVCLAGVAMILSVNQAKAIGLSPLIVDQELVDPGDRIQFDFTILSDYDKEKTFYFSTQNFTSDGGEYGGQSFIDDRMAPSADLASWITVIQDSVTIEARGEKKANAVITIPENAEPGSHTAVIWVGESDPNADSVSVIGNIGVLILLNVSGDVVRMGSIKEFNYLEKYQNRLPVDFYARVSNEGTAYYKPGGEVAIKNIFGRKSATIDANPKRSNILPHSIRRIEGINWVKKVYSAEEKKEQDDSFFSEAKREFENFGFGPYKAYLTMSYGPGEKDVMTAVSSTFWVIPWRLIIIFVVVLFVLYLSLKVYNRSVANKSKEIKLE